MFLIKSKQYTKSLKMVTEKDLELVGLEALEFAKFGELEVEIPRSFVLSSLAFDDFIVANNIAGIMGKILSEVTPFDQNSAKSASQQIANLILTNKLPETVEDALKNTYSTFKSSSRNPFVTVSISTISNDQFIEDSSKYKEYTAIAGFEQLVSAIKNVWLDMFSPGSIELRTNTYYNGPITAAVIVKEQIRSELSGRAYSIPPITQEIDTIEVHAVFGSWDENFAPFADIYKIDHKNITILQKNIIPQEFMKIFKGGNTSAKDAFTQIPISASWRRHQKLSDDSILRIAQLVSKIEKKLKKPVEIAWSIQGGELCITDVKIIPVKEPETVDEFENVLQDNSLQNKVENEVKIHDVSTPKKKNIAELSNEIESLLKGRKEEIDKMSIKFKRNELSLVNTKKKKLVTSFDNHKSISKKMDIKLKLYLELSNYSSTQVNLMSYFDGGVYDGTNLVLEHDTLPESVIGDRPALYRLSDSYCIDLSVLARNIFPKTLIYEFSNITEFQHKLLKVNKNKFNIFGDERFIEYPESLGVEAHAVKRARHSNDCTNISISIPAVRSIGNLQAIKDSIAKEGLKRSDLMKLYVELAIPSFVNDFENLELNIVDGLIVNYDSLLKLYFYRSEIRSEDHEAMLRVLEKIKKHCDFLKIEILLKIDAQDDMVLRNLIKKLSPSAIIFTQVPSQNVLEIIDESE